MIRQPAAEKLARTLLEMRPSRLSRLSEEFFTATAKIIMAHVALDEERQRSEKMDEPKPRGAAYKDLGRQMAHGKVDLRPEDE